MQEIPLVHPDGQTDRGKSKCPLLERGHKNYQPITVINIFSKCPDTD